VLHYLGISPATINPATDILTTEAGRLVLSSNTTFATATHVQRIQSPGYTSEPTSLMTLAGLHRKHWTQIHAGWLINSGQPVTATQLAAAREVAAKAGLTIEARNTHASLEAAGDLRTLTATGATSTTRRTLTATGAGARPKSMT
jgi:putative ABC transport system permease protein